MKEMFGFGLGEDPKENILKELKMWLKGSNGEVLVIVLVVDL